MKQRRQMIISILGILSVLLVTAGVSFAFFSYAKEGSKENTVKLGSITFKYTENETLENGISIEDAFPISDSEGKVQVGTGKVFDFEVEANLSRSDIEYEVVAEPTEESTLPLDAIKFYLTDITNGSEEEIESTVDVDGNVRTLDSYSDTQIENATGKTVYQETILKNTKGYLKQFRARMWLREDLDWTDENYMGKTTTVKINVYANSNRSMASTGVTTTVDTSIERVTANNKYLFTESTEEETTEYQYTLTVPNEVNTLNVDVIPSSTEATVELEKIESLAYNSNTLLNQMSEVKNSVSRLSAVTEEVTAKISEFELKVGDNFFRATVTSSDRTKKNIYILKVVREASNNTNLQNIEVSGYTLTPSYNNSDNLYEVEVPYETTSVEVIATKAVEEQTLTGTGIHNLEVGSNIIKVVVTAENGQEREIQITVNRKRSDDASINNVGVKGYTLSQVEENIYSVEVVYNIESIEIENISTTGATVTGIGIKNDLAFGNNDYEVEVTSQDGTITNKYIIRIIKNEDTTNTLKSLSLTDCTLSPTFNKEVLSYTCTVENSVTKTTVTAEATSEVATVKTTGGENLVVGDNTVEVVVTSQSGVDRIYTVVITRKPNSDASLKTLEVTGQALTPTFDKNVLAYTLSVPYSIDNITITGTPTSSVSTVEGLGTQVLTVGENVFNIIVTAEDGTIRTYEITVTRLEDTDTSLKSISVTGQTIVKVDENHYTLTVANDITSAEVNAEAISSVAIVTGTGIKTLNVGSNVVQVTVTAQNGDTSIYEIDITRLASSDATLKSLTVSSGTLSPTFASSTTAYTLTVPYSVTSLTVTGTVNNSEASYTVSGNTGLVVGTNTVTVKVTAGDGTEKTYTITVTREKDTDATLKSLSVTGYSLTPTFDSETTSYTLELEASSVEITAEANSSVAASVSGIGTKTLSWGTNTASVIVTAQDGTVKTYIITITNQQPTAPVITGGSSEWVSTAPTISVATEGSAISGVKHYEYVFLPSNAMPVEGTSATGTTSGDLTVSDEGITYVWYRTVSNNGFKSAWTSSPQVVNLDTDSTKLAGFAKKIYDDNTLIAATPTLTTSSNNTSDASGLYKSTDTNDGSSTYYFRGSIANNYVDFAGYTWRIVRINEDGTIRIILNNSAYSQFNPTADSYTKMYYSNSNVASGAKYILDNWFTTNLSNYSDIIATGNYYCEQAKVKLNSNYTSGNATMSIYSSYTPNFKCSTDGNGYGIVNSNIGLITYDELVHSGSYYQAGGSSYALYYGPGTGTMSPAGYLSSASTAQNWTAYAGQGYINPQSVSSSNGQGSNLRPVINLKSEITVTGTGTSTDPYKIPEPAQYQLDSNTYAAGDSVTWAGLDWYVIDDEGNQTTLVLKTNYATGSYGSATTFEGSTAYTSVNEDFLTANTTVKAAIDEGSVVSQGTYNDLPYYVRLPEQTELSTSIPNDSSTSFWTQTINGSGLYFGKSTGAQGTKYASSTTVSGYAGAGTYTQSCDNVKVSYITAVSSSSVVAVSATKVNDSYTTATKYKSSSCAQSYGSSWQYCDASKGATTGYSYDGSNWTMYPASTSGCTSYKVYTLKSTNLGYRPVVTVLEG